MFLRSTWRQPADLCVHSLLRYITSNNNVSSYATLTVLFHCALFQRFYSDKIDCSSVVVNFYVNFKFSEYLKVDTYYIAKLLNAILISIFLAITPHFVPTNNQKGTDPDWSSRHRYLLLSPNYSFMLCVPSG